MAPTHHREGEGVDGDGNRINNGWAVSYTSMVLLQSHEVDIVSTL